MAFVKYCDSKGCGKRLGGQEPFVQTKGSVSDQYEPLNGPVEYRYLTGKNEEKHTFCNDSCEMDWRQDQRDVKKFNMV